MTRYVRPLPDDNPSAMAGWLLAEVDFLRHHEAAAEAVDEITSVVKAVRHAVDRPADRVFVGVCSTVNGEVECQELLYAKVGAAEVRCRVCGATHQVDDRRAVLRAAVEDYLATPTEITQAVAWAGEHVRKDQITRWVQGDRLVARGHGATGRAMYRIGDVLDLLAKKKAS